MKGITIAEQCHVVNALPPIDIGGVAKTSDYWSMKDASHVTIIVTLGVVGNAPTITVEESDDLSGSNTTAIAFDYYAETTADGDTLAARASATTAGYTAPATTNNVMLVIEIDASELSADYPCLVVKTDNAAACLVSVVAILSGTGYRKEITPTAIA